MPKGELADVVAWRRRGDRIHQLEHWAVPRTRHLPVEDRSPTLRAMLPSWSVAVR